MANIRQIARLAGVAISTVSLALRDDPRLRPETKARIREIAEQYHYRPNRLGMAFMTGKSRVIGCVIQQLSHPFYVRILKGVLEQAYAESYQMMVLETDLLLEHTCQAIHTLLEHRVDGIIIATGPTKPIPKKVIFEIRSSDTVPVGIDNSLAALPIDQIASDETELAQLAVDYLWKLGHQVIAFAGTTSQGFGTRYRIDAIKHALNRRGLPTHYFIQAPDYQSTADSLFALMAQPVRPTAIIAEHDAVAGYLLQTALHRGLQIPRDLSILGFGHFYDKLFIPRLTTLEQYPERMGRDAISLLCRRIAQGANSADTAVETITVPPSIIKSDSCAAPEIVVSSK